MCYRVGGKAGVPLTTRSWDPGRIIEMSSFNHFPGSSLDPAKQRGNYFLLNKKNKKINKISPPNLYFTPSELSEPFLAMSTLTRRLGSLGCNAHMNWSLNWTQEYPLHQDPLPTLVSINLPYCLLKVILAVKTS